MWCRICSLNITFLWSSLYLIYVFRNKLLYGRNIFNEDIITFRIFTILSHTLLELGFFWHAETNSIFAAGLFLSWTQIL